MVEGEEEVETRGMSTSNLHSRAFLGGVPSLAVV